MIAQTPLHHNIDNSSPWSIGNNFPWRFLISRFPRDKYDSRRSSMSNASIIRSNYNHIISPHAIVIRIQIAYRTRSLKGKHLYIARYPCTIVSINAIKYQIMYISSMASLINLDSQAPTATMSVHCSGSHYRARPGLPVPVVIILPPNACQTCNMPSLPVMYLAPNTQI